MTNTIDILRYADAIFTDQHFVYVSGKHGSAYINIDPILPDLKIMSRLCASMAEPFAGEIDTVIGPATGGIAFAVLVAQSLGEKSLDVAAIWADKVGDGFDFSRAGFRSHLMGKRALVVDDILTTGGSVQKICTIAELAGANIAGVSVVCNRSGKDTSQLGFKRLEALVTVDFSSTTADKCELCAQGLPIVDDVGHGSEFKSRNPGYTGGYVSAYSRT